MSSLQKFSLFAAPVLLIILTGLAGFALAQSNHLSLPIPFALTLFTLLLPLFTWVSTTFVHRLLCPALSHTSPPTRAGPTIGVLIPIIVVQAIYNTAIFVLNLTYTSSSSTRCVLERRWATLFAAHNSQAIRTIQDALECCGFAGTRDRPYPFPVGPPTSPGYIPADECTRRTGYTRGCSDPWAIAQSATAGRLALVAGGVFIVQVIYFASVLYSSNSGGGGSWINVLKAIGGSAHGAAAEERRANMRGLIDASANGDSERVREVLDREEEDGDETPRNADETPRRLESGEDNGPRVETSSLLDGWREQSHGHGTIRQ